MKKQKTIKLKNLLKENSALGILPSSKLIKMKWNPLTEAEPMNEDGGYALAYDNFYRGMESLLSVVSKKDKQVAKKIANLQQKIELELSNL